MSQGGSETTWTSGVGTISNTEKKSLKEESVEERTVVVPVTIFRDRTLAPLEAVSVFLKDNEGKTYHEIAALLNRDDRTIWTCYNRGKKKLGSNTTSATIPARKNSGKDTEKENPQKSLKKSLGEKRRLDASR
ncbi:TPA: hypothetical protein HA265_08530 [Candidatus Woesearchaeota archaeon]|nr:hypothetical protein [Candidatus Woesearchaeota archaeon]